MTKKGSDSDNDGTDKAEDTTPTESICDCNIPIFQNEKDFKRNLPETVELIETENGDRVYVVGTAHFSLKSQDDVSLVIRNVKPNVIVLELCPLRMHILDYDEVTLLKEAQDLSPEKIKAILRDQGFSHGLFYLSFLRASANITRQLGVAPGGECRRAVAEAKKLESCRVLLGDRPMNITLKRALYNLSFQKKMQISMALNNFDVEAAPMTQDDVEMYKDRERESLLKMKETMPTVYNAFVTERDIILAHSLLLAVELAKEMQTVGRDTTFQAHQEPLKPVKVVGVVGIGHLRGIIENFGKTNPQQIKELMKLKPSKYRDAKGPTNTLGLFSYLGQKCWNFMKFCLPRR